MSTGYLQIFTLSASDGFPVDAVSVTVNGPEGETQTYLTDSSGYSDPISLPAPDESYSLDPDNTTVLPYSVCTVTASRTGWQDYLVKDAQIFAGQTALLTLQMQPVDITGTARAAAPVYTVPEHGLFSGTDTGSGAAPSSLCDTDTLILENVIIPSKVIVHLAKPAVSGTNVTVSFRDYIKNVACSEIYPTWPVESLRANIYAQISLALNRVYTEWYPSKGYSFNITNSTSYDQYYVHGRDIFASISTQVDDIFNTYIRKTGTVNPFYAEYCDGKTVTNCPGMKQWGTKTLAEQGKTAIQILRYYYGNDIELVTTNNIGAIPESYPGTPLKLGSTGIYVSIIQRQLNRISKNYPALGTLTVNGVFDAATESTVKQFQKQFSLTQDGIVGKSTWYKISYIYVAVKKLAELTSEGEEPSGLPSGGTYPGTTIKEGDSGASVKQIQFWLSVLAQFETAIPNVAVDGKFGPLTTASVKAFQASVNLTVDGIVGRATWTALYDAFISVESDITLPGTDWVGEYPGTPLRVGSTGNEVRLVQFWLTVISDFYPAVPSLTPDGIYGNATKASVTAFQTRFSLDADGVVGQVTWNKLFEIYTSQTNGVLGPNGTPGIYPGSPLQFGSTGIYVKEMQFYLYLLGAYYPSIPIISYDGIFGSATQKAVIAYQTLAGLTADGIVGQVTWQSLYGAALRLRDTDGPTLRFILDAAPAYTVKPEMSGNEVLFLQYELTLAGCFYDTIPDPGLSGAYDQTTINSVSAFQDLFSLPDTGSTDTETWNTALSSTKTLLDVTVGEEYVATGDYPGYVIGPDSVGPAVSELQYYINAIAEQYCVIDFLNENGWFGPQTETVVKEFQEGFGLPVTGVVDEVTWDTIFNYYSQLLGSPARAVGSIKIFVYDQYENKMYIFYRNASDPMPYSSGTTLSVKEFRGSSNSNVLWTTTRAMESWNETRRTYGSAIPVGYAFKRIWEGGHGTTSQHYAGVAFDVGQSLSQTLRTRIWNAAYNLGVWGYVEPLSMTPTWVHFDRRYGTPACGGTSGYPTCRSGSKSTYVLILQDALNALGYDTKSLDGAFGTNTQNALKAFQRSNSLTADGICGCSTWSKLAKAVVGIGRTPTVLD